MKLNIISDRWRNVCRHVAGVHTQFLERLHIFEEKSVLTELSTDLSAVACKTLTKQQKITKTKKHQTNIIFLDEIITQLNL